MPRPSMSEAATWGWWSWQTLTLAGFSVLVVGLWIARSVRTPDPLVDLRLAGRRGVVGANVAAVLAGTGIYLMISLVMVLSQAPESTGYGLGTRPGMLSNRHGLVPSTMSPGT